MDYRELVASKARKLAQMHLDVCKKYVAKEPNVYSDFILGKGTAAVTIRNQETGQLEQSIWAVMETLYDDYKKHPEEQINRKLYEVLEKEFQTSTAQNYLLNGLNCVEYQMLAEEQNRAPFRLDNKKLLEEFSENIRRNYGVYSKNDELMEMLEDKNENISQGYGYTIL